MLNYIHNGKFVNQTHYVKLLDTYSYTTFDMQGSGPLARYISRHSKNSKVKRSRIKKLIEVIHVSQLLNELSPSIAAKEETVAAVLPIYMEWADKLSKLLEQSNCKHFKLLK